VKNKKISGSMLVLRPMRDIFVQLEVLNRQIKMFPFTGERRDHC